jgi:hypothetical protein
MSVNREHKNSVFTFLFDDPAALRDLYGALEGITLPPDVPICINTLSDVLFLEQLNDLSFIIDNRLVILIEHQSTINPNMALRLLMYIGRLYEKMFDRKKLYSSKPIKIPLPEFFVLYNGIKEYPDQNTLKLSDLFEKAGDLTTRADIPPVLDLEVKIYNINKGHNAPIIQKCKILEGYSIFIDKIREYQTETGDKEKAMSMAITYCTNNNILKNFLEANGSEVQNMLITEWNTVEYGDVKAEEGREEGRVEGRAEGRAEVAKNALAEGATVEFVQKITGLDIQTIQQLVPR